MGLADWIKETFGWQPDLPRDVLMRYHAGAATEGCGPYEFWDEQRHACIPLALPMPTTGPGPVCPPGQFYDYLRGICVSSAPHAAGAQPCGPTEYWDEQHQACVPLALPPPTTVPAVQCPPGQFYDYLRQACVSSTPHAASGLGDVTVGAHLISPLGWPYAWGQALGLWGQRDPVQSPGTVQSMVPPTARQSESPDWKTVFIVGAGAATVLGLGYMILKSPRSRSKRMPFMEALED